MASVHWSYFRMPLVLLSVVVLVCIATVFNPPAGRINRLLEVGPGLAGITVLIALCKRFPMSQMAYLCIFIHVLRVCLITRTIFKPNFG